MARRCHHVIRLILLAAVTLCTRSGLLGYGSDAAESEDDDSQRAKLTFQGAGGGAADDDDDADAKPHKRRSMVDLIASGNAIDGKPALAGSAAQVAARLALFKSLFNDPSSKQQAAKTPRPTNPPESTFHTAVTWSTPKVFCVKFALSGSKDGGSGSFVAKFTRQWAPQGVTHVLRLLRTHFYDDNRIFRVVPGFVAQWGLSGNPAVTQRWAHWYIQDDPPNTQLNEVGTISFAKAMANGRSTQLFVNLGDNTASLDKAGFVPVGRVVRGMDALSSAVLPLPPSMSGGQKLDQGKIMREGNAYLNHFPGLTTIETARITPCPAE